eukprot:TRINITY_DN14927_c0_g2_i1.p2 TRINITY_DN14927_c0_g2~~TRINITY_DN14927_c0_g2_i1.p2  ORF type:complete len:116 (+),score=41.49 TRINITY_DN14927_c0_g2_i1:101-448(+)
MLKGKVAEKEQAEELAEQKFKVELAVRDKEWAKTSSDKEDELSELKQKFKDLIMIYKKNKRELEEAKVQLRESEDVIENYKGLMNTLTHAKDKALEELEKADSKIFGLMKTLNVL